LRSLAFPQLATRQMSLPSRPIALPATLDQGTGALLAWSDLTGWQRVSETIYMLHTGQGAAGLGLILGLMALGVPIMTVTGVILWLAGWRARPRIRGNATAGRAETILLVGSEGGSTWGFAATLHAALTNIGQTVHAAAMSSFDPARYGRAQRILILAATYGDGDAPASAKGFIERLRSLPAAPAAPLAVLGFGDRSFPAYCAFAQTVAETAEAKGWRILVPFDTIDRQSTQDFARCGRVLGAAMGVDLELVHETVLPAVRPLTLVSRRDYGAECRPRPPILRFALPNIPLSAAHRPWLRWLLSAGDLLGILPEGSAVPRFYSLASGRRDGFIEIVVRNIRPVLCSGQLLGLEVGDTINGFLRANPASTPAAATQRWS